MPWKTLMLRHGDLKQRMYYLPPRWAGMPRQIASLYEPGLRVSVGFMCVSLPGCVQRMAIACAAFWCTSGALCAPLTRLACPLRPCSHAVPLPPPLVSNGVAAAARGVAKKPSKPAKKRPRKR